MFLYGATNVSFNLADLFISQVETLPARVRTGTFDSLLIRPLGPLFQLATEEFAAPARRASSPRACWSSPLLSAASMSTGPPAGSA